MTHLQNSQPYVTNAYPVARSGTAYMDIFVDPVNSSLTSPSSLNQREPNTEQNEVANILPRR